MRFPEISNEFSYSNELKDIITQLLTKNASDRLGAAGGSEEILQHPWFADLDKDALLNKQL